MKFNRRAHVQAVGGDIEDVDYETGFENLSHLIICV